MSKVAIAGNPSGTATFTIESPATNTDRTLVLPDNAGTLLTSASTANFPAGSVLQVVRATDSTDRSTSSSTFVDAGISVTITPQSASSNIILIWAASCAVFVSSGTSASGRFAITDASNNVIGGENRLLMDASSAQNQLDSYQTFIRYVSPNTTSAVTYKGRFRLTSGTAVDIFNSLFAQGQLFAIEVAA
jgi:hypothetical protein